ncbi:MAG TPA: M81 family metallopeptidase [Spirochaetia bacterium]|nr:M81 family metallopeptidase [Spirochaetia bacterium]
MKKWRIAVGGFSHETNTFSPVCTEIGDFQVLRGAQLLEERLPLLAGRDGQTPTPAACKEAELSESVELLPCLFARALPGGLIRKEAYLCLKRELLEMFESNLPVDGIYLDLHGAAEVEDIGDGEGDFIHELRGIVGSEVPIAVSLDLHGNISEELADSADILTAYRTAPHRDAEQTRLRALRHLVDSLRNRWKPRTALIKVPLLLPGEMAMTDLEPARSLYARLSEIDRVPGLLDSSLLAGCCWTDSIHTSASVLVVARQDRVLAEKHARLLFEEVWAGRRGFVLPVEAVAPDEAVRIAMATREHPVFISDSGDNITGGAAGDIPLLAERLLAAGARDALVAGITDVRAVERCAAVGVGAELELDIGGRLDSSRGKPLHVKGKVKQLVREGEGGAIALRHGSSRDPRDQRAAVGGSALLGYPGGHRPGRAGSHDAEDRGRQAGLPVSRPGRPRTLCSYGSQPRRHQPEFERAELPKSLQADLSPG